MQVASSSVNKGESLLDTAATLNALDPAWVCATLKAALALLASKVQAAVVNGGGGTHEHPTQALLDTLTLRRHLVSSKGYVAIWVISRTAVSPAQTSFY